MLYENLFSLSGPRISMSFCFEALESMKISSYKQVSSQKYENGYRTKICDFMALLCFALWWWKKRRGKGMKDGVKR